MQKSERPVSYQKRRSIKFSETSDPYFSQSDSFLTQDNIKFVKANTSKVSKWVFASLTLSFRDNNDLDEFLEFQK